eukprot:Lankesteria_metandrocarpae@DN6599_c0_g1_i1.p1
MCVGVFVVCLRVRVLLYSLHVHTRNIVFVFCSHRIRCTSCVESRFIKGESSSTNVSYAPIRYPIAWRCLTEIIKTVAEQSGHSSLQRKIFGVFPADSFKSFTCSTLLKANEGRDVLLPTQWVWLGRIRWLVDS